MLVVTGSEPVIGSHGCARICRRSRSQRCAASRAVQPREDQQELLAAHPCRDRRSGGGVVDQFGDVLQYGVAGVVRERVVDPLEMVQVEDRDRDRGVCAAASWSRTGSRSLT